MVLAIAVSLVCFLVVTAMVALSRFELQATTGKAASTRRYFAARGQVQELLQQVNSGAAIDSFTSPVLATIDGWEVESRAIPDPSGADGVYHLVASIDDERLAEATVHIGQPHGGGSFAGVLTGLPDFPTAWPHRFFQQTGEGAWTPIPSVPMECHDVNGNPIAASRVGWFYVADMLGHLVASTAAYDGSNQRVGTGLHRYDPDLNGGAGGWESLGPIPRAIWLGANSWELSSTQSEITPLGGNPLVALGHSSGDLMTNFNYLGITRNGREIYDRINYGNATGLEGCVFRKLDVSSRTWSLIPGPRSSQYLPDGTLTQQERPGMIGFIAGASENGLVCVSNNVVCRLTGTPPAWEYLPPVPKHYFDNAGNFHRDSGVFTHFGALAVGPHDEVYVGTDGLGGAMAISKYDPRQGWTSLRPPPDTPNWAVGGYLSVDGNGALLLESYHERDWWMRYDGEVWRKLPPLAFAPALGEGSHHAVGSRSLNGARGRVVKRVLR